MIMKKNDTLSLLTCILAGMAIMGSIVMIKDGEGIGILLLIANMTVIFSVLLFSGKEDK